MSFFKCILPIIDRARSSFPEVLRFPLETVGTSVIEQMEHEMAAAQFNLRDLEPGATYAFAIKKTVAANDDAAPVETELRNYLGFYIVGGVSFLDVKRSDGLRHLIACETIADIAPC